MAILRQAPPKVKTADKSMYIADEKIDRKGNAWKKQAVWIRGEYLGKMKVISHFEKKDTQQILDEALSIYINRHWNDSMAVKKMIQKSGY
ncbi:MAG: hypothetical protein KAR42_17505 [candidate division Zixibacteria bacterium]|nr:hypothetical protein [candidate division Zixibacteria bacterium]